MGKSLNALYLKIICNNPSLRGEKEAKIIISSNIEGLFVGKPAQKPAARRDDFRIAPAAQLAEGHPGAPPDVKVPVQVVILLLRYFLKTNIAAGIAVEIDPPIFKAGAARKGHAGVLCVFLGVNGELNHPNFNIGIAHF